MCWINSTQFPGKAARAGTGPGHFPALISLMDLNVGAGKAFYSRAVLSQNPVLGMPMAPGLAGCWHSITGTCARQVYRDDVLPSCVPACLCLLVGVWWSHLGTSCALLLHLLIFSARDKAGGCAVFTSSAGWGFARLTGTVLGCGELAAMLIFGLSQM